MNFLELVQETMAILRIGQNEIGSDPTTVVGQLGKSGEVVRFVRRSWVDLQNEKPGWRFLRRSGTITLPLGQSSAATTAIPDFDLLSLADSDGQGRHITLFTGDGSNEQSVRYVPWRDWQQSHIVRGNRGTGFPGSFTLRPDNSLEFDLAADVTYTARFWYKRTPQQLQVNSDIPIMPSRHHMAIVWWAIHYYFCTTRSDAQNLERKARQNLDREMRRMYNEQLEEWRGIEAMP